MNNLPVSALNFMMGEYVRGWTSAEGSYADKRLGKVALVKWDLLSAATRSDSALWH